MAFKMKGFSGFKKETNLPEEEQQRITDKNKKDKTKVEESDDMEKYLIGMSKEEWDAQNPVKPKGRTRTKEDKLKRKRILDYTPQTTKSGAEERGKQTTQGGRRASTGH